MEKKVPSYSGTLRDHTLLLPFCISKCSGIRIFGKRIKSIAFSTDVAIIKNINADAVIAVYPFTPQAAISQAIIQISDVPVFVGVGGGITSGERSVQLAMQAEHQGAYGVVVNAPMPCEVIHKIKSAVDIPVIVTVVSERMDVAGRIAAGADFVNVSGAANTARIVRKLRAEFPELPSSPPADPRTHPFWRPLRPVPTPSPSRRPPTAAFSPESWKNTGIPFD